MQAVVELQPGRLRRNVAQFVRFGAVGGSGMLVNMATLALCDNVGRHVLGIDTNSYVVGRIGADVIYVWVAFLAAVSWNFVLNRAWTFKGRSSVSPWRQYGAFVATGALANIATTLIYIALSNPRSPLCLPSPWFVDDAPFWARRLYWAQALAIVTTMPVNFLVNKLWAFRAPKEF